MAHLDYIDPDTAPSDVRSFLGMDAETHGRPSLCARIMAHHPALLEAR
jgi:hypothetical protein